MSVDDQGPTYWLVLLKVFGVLKQCLGAHSKESPKAGVQVLGEGVLHFGEKHNFPLPFNKDVLLQLNVRAEKSTDYKCCV